LCGKVAKDLGEVKKASCLYAKGSFYVRFAGRIVSLKPVFEAIGLQHLFSLVRKTKTPESSFYAIAGGSVSVFL
jgi:hypothetical protein